MDLHRRAITCALLLAAGTSFGKAPAVDAPSLTAATLATLDAMAAKAKGRPNEEYRAYGLIAYRQRDYPTALRHFEKAAYHADKFSHHYLSLMHWHGVGTPVDHALGYAWADLAAERGSTKLLLLREKMWSALSPREQADAAARGADLYARYGDDVAKRRAEARIRRFVRNPTGSRAGWGGNVEVVGKPMAGSFEVCPAVASSGSANVVTASAADLYGVDLEHYWRQQDLLINTGSVKIGRVEPVREP